jgi:hypothetical protein
MTFTFPGLPLVSRVKSQAAALSLRRILAPGLLACGTFLACGLVLTLPVQGADAVPAAPTANSQSSLASVRGVTKSSDGQPLARALVLVHGVEDNSDRTSTSGLGGEYFIAGLQPGHYQVYASKDGFVSSPATVELAPLQDAQLDFAFQQVQAPAADPDSKIALVKEVQAMRAHMAELEARLERESQQESAQAEPPIEKRTLLASASATKDPSEFPRLPGRLANPNADKVLTASATPLPTPGPVPAPAPAPQPAAITPGPSIPDALQSPPPGPAVDNDTPFAFGDFTWLNGSPRTKDTVLDTKYFTPEVRFDTHYMEDFNQPTDHTIGGATESFRSGEVQLEQISVGGDFHWQNVRGRVLYMGGLFATTTPRNDASFGVGQWDVRGAYKYTSEAYGGYHFNVNHGLNVDAGIFVSYIGLFSYYNFDNWTYQPSYVSSNTPWFFNGVRVQWFPTNKLKIEPWFINGWQSYTKYNGHPGLGGQLLWMPKEWFKLVANQYGYGQDNLGLPKTERIHTDDSIEVRYYNNPTSTGISKMAFSLTGDAGCQYGGGITCTGGPNRDSFVGWMLYDRMWFQKDTLALTLGGGEMSNYGRYLTLLPPINGADAVTGSPYFTQLPGQKAHMWDSTVTLQYMPKQYITWWAEVGYRHSDIPYFTGRRGITPPGFPLGGSNGAPGQFVCMSGAASGASDLPTATANCSAGGSSVWFPDLRRSETKVSVGVMVKF